MLKIKNLAKAILIMMSVFLLNTNTIKAEQKDCQGCSGSAFQTVNGDQQKPPGWGCRSDTDTAYIGYNGQMESRGETTQTLTVINGLSDANCYSWAITAGGGTLSSTTGTSTIYTIPESNSNCSNNPTIKLYCNGVEKAEAKIAVSTCYLSCWVWIDTSYIYCEDVPGNNQSIQYYYNCDGRLCHVSHVYNRCSTYYCNGKFHVDGEITDCRTPEKLEAGCCPEIFLDE